MHSSIRVGLVGDYLASVAAHQAIPGALYAAGQAVGVKVEPEWLPTDTIDGGAPDSLKRFDALWCVPASPYRSTDGALRAIRFARESGRPFLGTCGGFQHAVLEFAQDVIGWSDAAHAEIDPDADRPVITPLSCALLEERGTVHFVQGSRIAAAYEAPKAEESYHCRYGLNPGVQAALVEHGLRITATDEEGAARAIELPAHPFFVGTLFQPERAALRGEVPKLVRAFVATAAKRARS